MPEWLIASIPVGFATLFVAIGALFRELREQRDRLIRMETTIERLPCAICEVPRGPGA